MSAGSSFFVIGGNVLVAGLVAYCTVRFVVYLIITRRVPRPVVQHSQEDTGPPPTMVTPAEILQSMFHNLTAVHRSHVSSGETCAICLGELAHAVERTGVKEEGVAHAVKTGSDEERVANAGPVIVSTQLDSAGSTLSVPGARSAESGRADDAAANGPALQSLPCGHCFHGECIRGWIVHRGTGVSCPLCKYELVTRSPTAVQEDPADRV
eukprot:scaffold13389_cov134-Isochrysis_galbana.AAC.3